MSSQNWHRTFTTKKQSRGADTVEYVFCSKQLPAVIDEAGARKFLVTFLTPNDANTHGHANSVSLEMYLAVCHGRFLIVPTDDIAGFASALSYNVRTRDEQPTIDKPEKIIEFLNEK